MMVDKFKGFAGPNTVALLLTVGLLGALVFGMVTIDSQSRQIIQLSRNSDSLREQVKSSGNKPVAPPAKTVTGDAGQDGQDGPRGFTGDQGPRGYIGLTGVAGLLGAVGPVGSNGLNGLDGMTGADGAAGQDGAPGADGATGAAGADSTVPGPAGPPPQLWAFTDQTGTRYVCTRSTDPTMPDECVAQPKPLGVTP